MLPTNAELLLKAILADPDDDTARLLYADALDEAAAERGEPIPTAQAELIRVQVEFARLDEVDQRCPFVPEYSRPEPGPKPVPRWRDEDYCMCPGCGLVRREQPLLRDVGPRLFEQTVAPLFVPSGCASWSVEGPQPKGQMVLHGLSAVQHNPFRRGFIENWTLQADQWLSHADAITAAHPVRWVTLTGGQVNWSNHSVHDGRDGFGGTAEYYLLRGAGPTLRRGATVRLPTIGILHTEIIRAVLEAEWPRITFDLP